MLHMLSCCLFLSAWPALLPLHTMLWPTLLMLHWALLVGHSSVNKGEAAGGVRRFFDPCVAIMACFPDWRA